MQTIDERLGLPSASSAERLVNCPGSHRLEMECPPSQESKDSVIGDRVHAVLAGDKFAPVLTEAEEKLRSECERVASQIKAKYINEGKLSDGYTCVSEKRAWITNSGKKTFSGRWDRLYHDGGTFGLIIDFKTGRDEVDAADVNWQLLSLAVVASEAYNLNEVAVAIVQPWAKGQYTLAEYGLRDLSRASSVLRAAIGEAATSNTYNLGKWCKWCRAQAKCEKFQGQLLDVAATAATALVAPREMTLDAPKIVRLLKAKPLITKFFKDLEGQLKAQLKAAPDSIPGVTLKPGAKTRDITSVRKFWITIRDEYGSDVSPKVMEACEIGIGKAEGLLREITGVSADEAEELLNTLGEEGGWLTHGTKEGSLKVA